MVSVNPDLPVNNVDELIEYARANPGELNFGSAGFGTSLHLAGELFKNLADIGNGAHSVQGQQPGVHRPDQRPGPGDVSDRAVCAPARGIRRYPRHCLHRKVRTPAAPDLPTVAESGLPDYEASIWYAVLAPAGTPKEIVNRLNAEFHAVLDMPEVRNTLAERGSEVETSTPEELDKFIRDELEKWTRVIKEADLKPIQ
ncbi:MAG: tripartite tricarboxylate transporter substrate-binding protein [Gammaproteobacteria bacterium]|nr:tripartite tricarboxylate transporter substrate-binding protein [Gammaproteobacteria bacterium]